MTLFHRIIIDGDQLTQIHRHFCHRRCDQTVRISSSPFNPSMPHQLLSDHFPTQISEPTSIPSTNQKPSDHHNPTAENDRTMVVLRVTHNMLTREPHCPICKEEFEMKQEIKVLPCTHFYHSTCLLSWSQIRNTCPICRFQVRVGPTNYNNDFGNSNFDNISDDNYDEFRFDDVFSLNWPSWSDILSLWPFNITTFLNRTFEYDRGSLCHTSPS